MIPTRAKVPPYTNPAIITAKWSAIVEKEMKNMRIYEAAKRKLYNRNNPYGEQYNLNTCKNIPVPNAPNTTKI